MHQPFRNSTPKDVYGAFEHRARSGAAKRLVERVHNAIIETEARKRKRKPADAARFYETVERFVGELLQAKAKEGKGGTGRFGRAMSARGFSGGVVGYDNVVAVRDGLEQLLFLTRTKGYPSYHISFDNPEGYSQAKGEAAKFKATPSLIKLAQRHGVTPSKIHQQSNKNARLSGSALKSISGRISEFKESGRTLRRSLDPRAARER